MKHENIKSIFNLTYNKFYLKYKEIDKTNEGNCEMILQDSKKIMSKFQNEEEEELCKHILADIISLWCKSEISPTMSKISECKNKGE